MPDLFSLVLENKIEDLEKNLNSDNINKVDLKGRTLLFYAVSTSNYKICEMLFQKGINPDIKCHNGESAIFDSARRANLKILENFYKKWCQFKNKK